MPSASASRKEFVSAATAFSAQYQATEPGSPCGAFVSETAAKETRRNGALNAKLEQRFRVFDILSLAKNKMQVSIYRLT